MKLYIEHLPNNERLVFQNTENWVVLHPEDGGIVGSWSECDPDILCHVQDVFDNWDDDNTYDSLLPKRVSMGMLDSIATAFGVNQYCIGCGEWFNQSTMTRGDGNELDGYDWYCGLCGLIKEG
jgi:hypothetical protein